MKKTLFLFSALLCFSCSKKEIKAEKGGIDIVSNIYFNASKGLDDMKSVVISKLNYKGDTLVELVPYVDEPELTEKILSLPTHVPLISLKETLISSYFQRFLMFLLSLNTKKNKEQYSNRNTF